MTHLLRALAILIAIAGVIDPAMASRRRAPIAIDLRMPADDDPGFAEAERIRRALMDGADLTLADLDPADAIVVLGNAAVPSSLTLPVFAITLSGESPRAAFIDAPPVRAFAEQQPIVTARISGIGLAGKTTEFRLETSIGTVVGQGTHTWTAGTNTHVAELRYVPTGPGIEVVRVVARTTGVETSSVDVPVVVEGRRPRVLVYEPRPSWAAAFVRQALESDVLFEVQALAHTSRGVVTRTGDAPQRLDTFDPERVDVILVGGLDALSASDLTVLRRFADERGGTVILAPDATVPERVRQAFDLPPTAEKLLEKPIALAFGALSVRASEVLHAEQAVIRRGNVLIAAGLDAWRFRDDAFDAFWRAVVADGAAAAIPAMQVSVEPMLARPGDPLTVRARFRDFRAPISAAATLVPAVGPEVPVRLWPGMAAGEMRGTLNAPDEGQYDVRVNASGDIREAPLVIRRDARRPAVDRGAAIARVAETSGGAVFQASELSALNDRLRALPARDVERVARPMRSAGWALAFAVLLSGDWAWRRRRGLR